MHYVVGCDVGSQALKAVLWSEKGQVVATGDQEYPIIYPQPAWAEQDANCWFQAMEKVIPGLLGKTGVSAKDVVAIGVDGYVDAFVPVREDGEPGAPSFLWMDRRAEQQCDQIARLISPDKIFYITGLNLDPSHTAPKILWLRDHKPEIYSDAQKLMPPATFVVYKLTGSCVIDFSNASSTMIFDVRTRQWSQELLDLMGISVELLPEVRSATEVVGSLTDQAARKLGLSPGTLVVVGCGDEHAACLGAGVIDPGTVADILGTAEPVCTPSPRPAFDSSQLVETHCHAAPDRWLLENPGFVSGGNYRWFRDNFGTLENLTVNASDLSSYDLLNLEAASVSPGSNGLVFLPCMMGAMAPEWNARARGVLYGLTLKHSRKHVIRAILEGSAYALRSIIERMQAIGCAVEEIRAVGGGARSDLLRQIRADVTGIPVALMSTVETTALGAALLAAVGAGLSPSLKEASEHTIKVAQVNYPIPTNQRIYDKGYEYFLRIYDSLKECFEYCES